MNEDQRVSPGPGEPEMPAIDRAGEIFAELSANPKNAAALEAIRREISGLLAERARLAGENARLTAERDALLRAFEPLLIEIEPYRTAQREEIERLVVEKKKWAEQYNRTCGNSNEMWFYSTEFRRSLEANLQPLTDAIRSANEAFERSAKDAGLEVTS